MKKLILFLLLFPAIAFAGRGGLGAAMCSQGDGSGCISAGSPSNENTIAPIPIAFGNAADAYYRGYIVNAGQTTVDVCTQVFKLTLQSGTLIGKTFFAEVWSLDANGDRSAVLATSEAVAGAEWASGGVEVTFTFPESQNVAVGNAVVVYMGGGADDSNHASVFIAESDNDGGYASYGRWNNTGVKTWGHLTYEIWYKQYAVAP